MIRAAAALVLLAATGCLAPQVSDEPGPSGYVLPRGTVVPSIEEVNPAEAEELEESDGVDDLVPLQTAFAGGEVVHVWDFGEAPAVAAPLFVLVRRDGATVTFLPHPSIVGVVPGDAGYSPFWAVFQVETTDLYDGEQITAVEGLAEAQRRGLIRAPRAQPLAINCPIVASGVRIAVGPGLPPRAPDRRFFYEGYTVTYVDLGLMPIEDGVRVPVGTRYLLRREGQEPLNERLRGVDLTGDGDLDDSNDVFAEVPGLATSTPLVTTTAVAVVATTASIDTSRDETQADLRRATQLFDPGPVAGVVVAVQPGTTLHNVAGQRVAGGL